MSYRHKPFQTVCHQGLEALAADNEKACRNELTAKASDVMFGEPFENHHLRFIFGGFDTYTQKLAQMIDTAIDDPDVVVAIRRTYQFGHLLGTMLIGKATDMVATLPKPAGGGYLDFRRALLSRAGLYFEKAPTLDRLTQSYESSLDPSGRQDEVVRITSGLVFERIDKVEYGRAEQHAQLAGRHMAEHPDLPGFLW